MIGSELKKRRERTGLSQTQLAAFLDVHPNTVAKWEQGVQAIPMSRVLRFMLDEIDALVIQSGHDVDAALARWQAEPPER